MTSNLPVIQGEFADVAPVVTPEEAKRAMQMYQEIANAVTDESDYQTFRDRDGTEHKFRKRSGWKKLERFFFVSVEIREERIFHDHNPSKCLRVKMPEHFKDVVDCGCPIKGVRLVVRATDTRSGRYSENIGICTTGERRVSANASLHDLATRAFNRGANRATADLIGVSDPSAEEKQAESGFSKEERKALAAAFAAAATEKKNAALGVMEDVTGLDDASDREVWVAFLKNGTAEDYAEIMTILSGAETDFDPDDVPVGGKE